MSCARQSCSNGGKMGVSWMARIVERSGTKRRGWFWARRLCRSKGFPRGKGRVRRSGGCRDGSPSSRRRDSPLHCAYKERSLAAKSCQRGALKNSANNIERVVSRIVASSSCRPPILTLSLSFSLFTYSSQFVCGDRRWSFDMQDRWIFRGRS